MRLREEPLAHFLVLGVLLFAADRLLPKGGRPGSAEIVVTRGQIQSMATLFERTWRRTPTPAEVDGLIDAYVREDVLYREGLALGLDRDDPVIRQRVRLKMDLLSEDAAAMIEPTERDLQAYLDTHAARFTVEPRYTFAQVFLDPGRHGVQTDGTAQALLVRLRRGDRQDAEDVGDATMLPHRFENVSSTDVARTLGQAFATALAGFPPGQWRGPVPSGFGVHLVRVQERMEARRPALAEVRAEVVREWGRDQRLAANERVYQDLRRRYMVAIENVQVAGRASGTPAATP
jgi:hypothetical protein